MYLLVIMLLFSLGMPEIVLIALVVLLLFEEGMNELDPDSDQPTKRVESKKSGEDNTKE